MLMAGKLNLEERTFGPLDEPQTTVDAPPPNPLTMTETLAAHMFPFAVTLVLCMIIAWSINKSIEYSELFQTNHRYKWAMMSVNVLVVLVGSALLLHSGKSMNRVV
jgi:hypothetical protein